MRPTVTLLSFLLIIFSSSTLFAQSGIITGKVADGGNNRPLSGATVSIIGISKNTVTDLDGNFRISGLSAGTYTLKVSYVGFTTKQIEGTSR